jgi:hypothetical protein
VPQQARQQEQQLAQQRLEQLRQGGQPEEKELAAELAAELAREFSRERDLQKALLSTQQGREKVWEKVMNIAREAVGDMRGLKSYMSDSDLEWGGTPAEGAGTDGGYRCREGGRGYRIGAGVQRVGR